MKLKDLDVEITKLEKGQTYLFQIDVGEMPKEQVTNLLLSLKDNLNRQGIDGIFTVKVNGVGNIITKELKQFIKENYKELLEDNLSN